MEVVEALAWEEVCDDALLLNLSYLDVTSAVRLTKGTSLRWRRRSESLQQRFPELWTIWYERLGYSPAKLATCSSILSALAESRRLSQNLMGRTSTGSCFPLHDNTPRTTNQDHEYAKPRTSQTRVPAHYIVGFAKSPSPEETLRRNERMPK